MKPSQSLLLLALVGCGGAPQGSADPTVPAAEDLPDVVLITLDTTRADRIGAYGYDKAITPNLDALSARGRRYERAYSPMPLTVPAHSSLFTGKTPPNHGVRSNGKAVLGEEANTLAEVFKRNGYVTAASVAAYVTTSRWGFAQGFDSYFEEIKQQRNFWASERPADQVVDDLITWKKAQDGKRPQFVWAHLYDVHFPYLPPQEWREKIPDRPYDAELAWTDSQVGRLIEAFDGENTLFVIVADHGESLGEHGEAAHGWFVYDSTQRVPWIMAGPGIDVGVIDEVVGLVDVAPTLLDAVGLPALPDIDGRVAPGDPAKPVYMESYQVTQRFGLAPIIAVVDELHKLIDTPKPELYKTEDTVEEDNLAAARGSEVTRLRKVLQSLGYKAPSEDDFHIDADVAAQLEALGYVEGSARIDPDTPMEDAKDHIGMLRSAQEIDRLVLQNKLEKADELLKELVEKYPRVTEFRNRYAKSLSKLGRFEDALEVVRTARRDDPDDPTLKQSEAVLLAELGRFAEAGALYIEVAEALPQAPRIRAATFTALVRSGDVQAAMEQGILYSNQYPEDYALAGAMGVELVKLGDLNRGVPLLELGARTSLPERDVCYNLSALAQGRGEPDKARELIERELKNWPKNAPARLVYVRLVSRDQDWDALLREAELLRKLAPRIPESHFWVAQALFNLKRYDECREAIEAGYAVDPEDPQLLILNANLLAHDGDREAGAKLVERAKRIQQERVKQAKQAKQAKAPPAIGSGPD